MSTLALALSALLLAADPAAEPRRFHEIDRDLTAALRAEAQAKNLAERGAAVRELAALFTELDRDPRLLTSPALDGHRARARGRLVNVRKDLMRDIARAEQHRRLSLRESSAAGKQGRRTFAERKATISNAEMALVAAQADADQREIAQHLAAELSLASYATGGPAQVFEAAGAGGGGAVGDFGEELVDLITRTIYPDSWQQNGGVCTIVYYRPLMCLVVTATGDLHHDVHGLLDALR